MVFELGSGMGCEIERCSLTAADRTTLQSQLGLKYSRDLSEAENNKIGGLGSGQI